MRQDTKAVITTLKEHIGSSSLKSTVRDQLSLFHQLISIDRYTIVEVGEAIGVPLCSLRTALSVNKFKVTNDDPILIARVLTAYTEGKTIADCQSMFRLGFRQVSIMVDSIKRPSVLQIGLTHELVKEWVGLGYTQIECADEMNITVSQLKYWLRVNNITYSIQSLFGDEIETLFLNDNRTITEIAKMFNVSYGTIRNIIQQLGLQKPPKKRIASLERQTTEKYGVAYYAQTPTMKQLNSGPQKPETRELTKEHLQRCIDSQYTLQYIGTLFNVTDRTVGLYLNKWNIKYETKEERTVRLINQSGQRFLKKSKTLYGDNYQYLTPYCGSAHKVKIKCTIHNHTFYQLPNNHLRSIGCCHCSSVTRSRGEQELSEFIHSVYDGVVIDNDRSLISPKEVDVYVPDRNIAIEYNGIYWHSFNNTKLVDKTKHQQKNDSCEQQGVQLLQIFEDEWRDPLKQQIWKSVISGHLGLHTERYYARNTQVTLLNAADANQFCDYNHLQGSCNHTIAYGLQYKGEVLCVATFGPSRFDKTDSWELIRFCTALNTRVPGGFSKLIKRFKNEHTNQLISYANRRWSVGGVYQTLGMTHKRTTKPNYFYTKDCKNLHSRHKFQKHKLEKKLDHFDDSLTEVENMFANGYRQIFDCGNLVYSYE